MKEIPLNNSTDFVVVDDDDFEVHGKYRWHKDFHGYASRWENKERLLMHRLIISAQKGSFVDHKNGNRLDNRKDNLRIVTRRQNRMNSRKSGNCLSKYKGVTITSNKTNPYRAFITVNKKTLYLGAYSDEIEAAIEYDKAATRFFGEYAKTNGLWKGDINA